MREYTYQLIISSLFVYCLSDRGKAKRTGNSFMFVCFAVTPTTVPILINNVSIDSY